MIPQTVKEIGKYSFYDIPSLTTVCVPVTVDKVYEGAFYEDIYIKDVYYGGTETQWQILKESSEKRNEPLFGEGTQIPVTYTFEADKWPDATDFTIIFNTRGGSTIDAQKVAKGGKVTKPSDPVRENYDFDGWYTDTTFKTAYDFTKEVTGSFTLYAKWTEQSEGIYTIKFDTQGGSGVASQKIAKGGKVTKPSDPVRENYDFDGWYTDTTFTTAYDFTKEVTGSFTLYAKWTEQSEGKYTIVFDTQGGSGVASQKVEKGGKVTKPADPVKEGFIFGGWYTDVNYGTAYDFSKAVTGNLTLYAKWTTKTKKECIVTFNTQGGSPVEAVTVKKGKKVRKPADPTKSGYIFAGWFKDIELKKIWNFSGKVKKDITLYAKWLQPADLTIYVGEKDNLPISKKTSRIIVSDKKILKVKRKGRKAVIIGKSAGEATVTTYSKKGEALNSWVVKVIDEVTIEYKVDFDTQGGSAVDPIKVVAGEKLTRPADPTRDGYDFGGWYTNKSYTTAYDFTKEVFGSFTLYAKWTERSDGKYTITFDTQGGSAVALQEVAKGGKVTKPADPVKEGFVFGGWYTDENYGTAYDFTKEVTGSFTLFAKWDKMSTETDEWIKDYDYTLDEEEKIIWLKKYKGTGGDLNVPAKALVNGTGYRTGVSGGCYYIKPGDAIYGPADPNIWDYTIRSIVFERGVEFASDSKYMFSANVALETLDLSGVDTSKVTDMGMMFAYCKTLTTLNLSGFDTSKVRNMAGMFTHCETLTTLDVSGFDTSNVTDMGDMFHGCRALTTLDVSGFDTSKVMDMGFMFNLCHALTTLDVSGFNTSEVTYMSCMFQHCNALTTLDVSGFDTSKVDNMSGMFIHCEALTTLDVSGFDTSKVDNMSSMFSGCRALTTLDVSSFNTSKVDNTASMFLNCEALTTLDVSGFDTSNVTDMGDMFHGCRALTTLDVSGFDTSKVTDMSWMFSQCRALTTLNTPRNVHLQVELPKTMYDTVGNSYDYLPQNSSESITLSSVKQ